VLGDDDQAKKMVTDQWVDALLHHLPPRLVTLGNHFTTLQAVLPYLSSHPNIQSYRQPEADRCELPVPFLPRTTDIELPLWTTLKVSSRSLTQIVTVTSEVTDIAREAELLEFCARQRDTLLSFKVRRKRLDNSLNLDIYLKTLAGSAPLLERLSIWHYQDAGWVCIQMYGVGVII
jgi:hypothetical protein